MQERRWSYCAVAGGFIGAAPGAGTAGGLVNASEGGKARIDEDVVRPMQEHRNLRALVEGHTDSVGSDAYNQRLSERRANAVRDYMISSGIDASRITTKGWGKSKPIASNKTKEGRAK